MAHGLSRGILESIDVCCFKSFQGPTVSFGQTLAKRRFSPIARVACRSRVSIAVKRWARGDFHGRRARETESFRPKTQEPRSPRAVIPRDIIRASDPSLPRSCLSRLRRALASLPFDRRIDGDLQNSRADPGCCPPRSQTRATERV